jgi:hypothetical protein
LGRRCAVHSQLSVYRCTIRVRSDAGPERGTVRGGGESTSTSCKSCTSCAQCVLCTGYTLCAFQSNAEPAANSRVLNSSKQQGARQQPTTGSRTAANRTPTACALCEPAAAPQRRAPEPASARTVFAELSCILAPGAESLAGPSRLQSLKLVLQPCQKLCVTAKHVGSSTRLKNPLADSRVARR